MKAILLRQGRRYPGRTGWTIPYRRWLAGLSFASAAQHIALQEYRDAIDETERRVDRLTDQLRQLVPAWRWAPAVAVLQALRGGSFITAVGLVAELGDLTRFGHPRELMAFLGLVPSEPVGAPEPGRVWRPIRARKAANADGDTWDAARLTLPWDNHELIRRTPHGRRPPIQHVRIDHRRAESAGNHAGRFGVGDPDAGPVIETVLRAVRGQCSLNRN